MQREGVEDGEKPSVAAPAAADRRVRAAAATPEGYMRPAHSKRTCDMLMVREPAPPPPVW